MKNPKTLWAVWGNGYGFRGPKLVKWSPGLKSWWDKSGNDRVRKVGLHWQDYNFSFSSPNKDEVITFIQGYLTCSKIVRNAVSSYIKV